MNLALIGLSHHQAPIAVRERLAVRDSALPRALRSVSAHDGIREAAILSTCNRVEVYAVLQDSDIAQARDLLVNALCSIHAEQPGSISEYLYVKTRQEVLVHLMRVACGLDSQVLGDAQILGQVRTSLACALECSTAGDTLAALFRHAIRAGKRVRTETGIGSGRFSIGRAAADLARSIFADLAGASILVLGAGKMSELTAAYLIESGARVVLVANRTYDRATALARRLGGSAIRYNEFQDALLTSDIVISSTAAPHAIISADIMRSIMRQRRGRPVFLVDIAVPRDIEESVGALDNVFLYNVDDLQSVLDDDRHEREAELERAEAIVVEEAARLLERYRMRQAAPVISKLRESLEEIRRAQLTLARARCPDVSDRDWQSIERATRAMMRRVARDPILRLKREVVEAGTPDVPGDTRYDLLTAAQVIFGLPPADESAPARPGRDAPVTNTTPDPETQPVRPPQYAKRRQE